MLKDIVSVRPLDGYRLHLRFEDGAEGEMDIAALVPFEGVFAPLRATAPRSKPSGSTLNSARSAGPTAPTSIRTCSTPWSPANRYRPDPHRAEVS